MRVMVTGGTGYVGAHTVTALLDAGHEVRLLVRDPRRIDEIIGPLGATPTDFVVGDMTDEAVVGTAMDGCDAVFHAAALVGSRRVSDAELVATNVHGAEIVLGMAARRGLDPIVHVSSVTAVYSPGIDHLDEDLPPATTSPHAYVRSKGLVEEYARRLQQDAPVVITYPGGPTGPAAGPLLGEVSNGMVSQLRLGIIAMPDADIPAIDVRDLAAVHAAVMEPGRGPRRFMATGVWLDSHELARVLGQVTGRRLQVLPIPGAVFRLSGRGMDLVTRLAHVETLFTHENMEILTRCPRADDRRVHEDLGIAYRDPRDTYREAVRALRSAGRISWRAAGRAVTG